MKTEPKSTKDIDTELAALKKKRAEIVAESEHAAARLRAVEAGMDEISLQTFSDDKEADRRLQEARLGLRGYREDIESCAAALRKLDEQIKSIEAERAEVEQKEIRAELVTRFDEMLAHVKKHPNPFDLDFIKSRWVPYTKFVKQARWKLGLDAYMVKVPSDLPLEFFRVQFFGLLGVSRPLRQYRDKSFAQMFEQERQLFTASSEKKKRAA